MKHTKAAHRRGKLLPRLSCGIKQRPGGILKRGSENMINVACDMFFAKRGIDISHDWHMKRFSYKS